MFKKVFNVKMLITFFMGFSSGLPLLLTSRTLQAWMTDSGVSLATVGFMSLAGIPGSSKLFWAPLMDRFFIPRIGRRKTWLFISQLGLFASLGSYFFINPSTQIELAALCAVLVSFFSASQDIVVDAYRREHLTDEELGLGSAMYQYGYRTAMWVSGGLAIGMAAFIGWNNTYLIMASIIGAALLISFTLLPEPKVEHIEHKSIVQSVIDPFKDFLSRNGAWYVLAFVLLYKIGDNVAGNMTTPMYLKIGYTKEEIATIAKTLGIFSSMIGTAIGGVLIMRIGIYRSLWAFGILQSLSTLAFAVLSNSAHNIPLFAGVVFFEDMSAGMGSSAFIAFMATMTNKKFTATQYALLTSIMALPRTVIPAPAGLLAEQFGWPIFFIFCALLAIPGLLMIKKMQKLASTN